MADIHEQIKYFEELFCSSQLSSMEASDLLLHARKFSRIEEKFKEKNSSKFINKKIAVLASYTTHHLIGVMKLFLYKEGISPLFYEGEYDGIAMGLLDPGSELFSFKPEILLLLTDHKDLKEFPPLFADQKNIDAWVTANAEFYTNLWNHASEIKGCQVFQTTFVLPIYRPLGNMEANYLFSPANCIKLLNLELVRKKPQNVTFIDMDYFSSCFGKRR